MKPETREKLLNLDEDIHKIIVKYGFVEVLKAIAKWFESDKNIYY